MKAIKIQTSLNKKRFGSEALQSPSHPGMDTLENNTQDSATQHMQNIQTNSTSPKLLKFLQSIQSANSKPKGATCRPKEHSHFEMPKHLPREANWPSSEDKPPQRVQSSNKNKRLKPILVIKKRNSLSSEPNLHNVHEQQQKVTSASVKKHVVFLLDHHYMN